MHQLLDGGEVYPIGVFADEAVLGVLERLGMRVLVTSDAVLQSARSIEALAASDAVGATQRARSLLQYVDVRADRTAGWRVAHHHIVEPPTWQKSKSI